MDDPRPTARPATDASKRPDNADKEGALGTATRSAGALEAPASAAASGTRQKVYHTGWRLHALTAGLCVSLLLSTLETTIVSTALVSIVDSRHGFDKASWIVTAYLLTYTGFLIIFSKLSDILGCKLVLLFAITLFTVFSIACGASKSMLSLTIFRAVQGMGGSGIYSLSTIMVPLMVPPKKFATYIAIVSSVFAISSVLGPLLGGAITDNTTWKWVFFLNGPGGAIAALLVMFSIPFGFPYGESAMFFRNLVAGQAWKRIDFVGGFVSLAASVLLIFALEQGGIEYPWKSGPVISTFVLSGLCWLAFVIWERWLSAKNYVCEPMFPWRLTANRFALGLFLNGFLTGFPFMTAIINIPQRLQTVNSTTAIGAGIRMLPLLLLSPVASALSGLFISKLKIPPFYILMLGGALQVIGVGCFSSLDASDLQVPSVQYGYQVLMSLGFGFNLSTILMMATIVVSEKDLAVTMGAVTQMRVLGGTIGLAISSALLIDHIKTEAVRFLMPDELARVLASSSNISLLSPEKQFEARSTFAAGYSKQMRVMLYFALASLLSISLLAEKRPRRALDTIETSA
ncbi:major facilitator superfamily transporter [Colletotrichum cereale]|nr:major facilitator superfamily transporter [Colletotrichum cereale]